MSNLMIDFYLFYSMRYYNLIFLQPRNKSILIDYEFGLDPRYNKNILNLQTSMNALFANPVNAKNQLLQIKLPFENVDNTLPIVAVPSFTTQFNG